MPSLNAISPEKLARLVGTPGCPVIVDVASGSLPASVRRPAEEVARWGPSLRGRSAVVVCSHGREKSAGAAAWLRHSGVDAEILEGGAAAWSAAGLPTLAEHRLPPRDGEGRTIWVTRARPKVDRIACPWLIRRFVDPEAVVLFVAAADVAGVAERFGATPFDVEGAHWSHRGELCTFDVMVDELGLGGFEGLRRLAPIVRGADTARPDLAPQAAGLLAASLGLSRMFADDLEQLEAGMTLYDALYRWCRDAVDETHDWVSHRPKRKAGP
ncbi:MAG TPA: sulfurtransferase/chromate resistance protein [Allosphingosinicella sp.]|nr:sulfurtransferase/chromate resistance protein [Allosphingosinicella sp.]